MRLGQKTFGNRYCVFARRNKNEIWTDWTQTNEISSAREQVEKIRNLGFLSKLKDRDLNEVLIEDGSKKIS